jgi:hypothetical protein
MGPLELLNPKRPKLLRHLTLWKTPKRPPPDVACQPVEMTQDEKRRQDETVARLLEVLKEN